MKKLLPILFVLIITSCSKEVPSDQVVERQGINYEINSDTPFSGTLVNYHTNGQLQTRENFKNGKRDGLKESYSQNGQLDYIEHYKDGKKDGLSESYYFDKGQLELRSNYIDGKLDGPYESYFIGGQPLIKSNYKDGRNLLTLLQKRSIKRKIKL
jgi:antitoxin component YwqK of YwqJK toxin-antitoxin module